MEGYNGFESKEEYLKYIKGIFYKQGLRCMMFSAAALLLLFYLHKNVQISTQLIPEQLFWFLQKATTVCFAIGAMGYLISVGIFSSKKSSNRHIYRDKK